MYSTQNPKVLNNALKYKLNPLLDKIQELSNNSDVVRSQMEDIGSQVQDVVDDVNLSVSNLKTTIDNLYESIDESNEKLSSLIVNNMYNVNLAPDSGGGEGSVPIEETPFIMDKTIKTICYGFVLDGINMVLCGTVNRGLGVGEDPAVNAVFDFRNPSNDKFNSFYINDILKLTTNKALIATNVGVIDYDLINKIGYTRDTTNGLTSKNVLKLLAVSTRDNVHQGYLAGCKNGVSYSPTGERWVSIDDDFNLSKEFTSFSKTQLISGKQTIIFIGTSSGVCMLDMDEYLLNDNPKIYFLKGISSKLVSSYINAVSYDTSSDKLYLATDSGVSVISNLSNYLEQCINDNNNFDIEDNINIITYSSINGLPSTRCYDVFIEPNSRVIVGTSNGLAVTQDFANYRYIAKKQIDNGSTSVGLNGYTCNSIVRKNSTSYTVIHPVGITESIPFN